MAVVHIYAQYPKRSLKEICGEISPDKIRTPKEIEDLAADEYLNPANWEWILCLSIPVDDIKKLQLWPNPYGPLHWLEYATGSVVGAPGKLGHSDSSEVVLDHERFELPNQTMKLYYHTKREAKRWQLPLDPTFAISREGGSTSTGSRVVTFATDVTERDDNRCVITSKRSSLCRAMHLVAHERGDDYIQSLTTYRSKAFQAEDTEGKGSIDSNIITDIDDVRNGLFVRADLHLAISIAQTVAILPIPNFAMPLTAGGPGRRYLAQAFDPSDLEYNGEVRSADKRSWPPNILFDCIYASAVLRHFGTKSVSTKSLWPIWHKYWYSDGGLMVGEREAQKRKAGTDVAEEMQRDANETRAQRRQRREDEKLTPMQRGIDALMMLPFILMPPEEVRAAFDDAEDQQNAVVQKDACAKVDAWLWKQEAMKNDGSG